jgi:RNA polymerase sigma-70 factor (ECF subfamily)
MHRYPGVLRITPALSSRTHPFAPEQSGAASFEVLYDTHFPYIWRVVLRLGVPFVQVDDVVQEVFLIAHRKLDTFEGRSTIKTWLYGIALRVARVHRVRCTRWSEADALDEEQVQGPDAARPDERAQRAEAARLVCVLLDHLDDSQREVFVLAELEQMSAREIAEALGLKLNTVYSRLRLARAAFAQAAARHRAQDGWRSR